MKQSYIKALDDLKKQLEQEIVEEKTGCRICGKIVQLDPHHIISQNMRGKVSDEIIDSPGNTVYICRS